ncbi:MAG: DUF86 domain-containing protein [Rhodospirillales bacterium]|nr:DUF86 domain-containing protein [Rhodospirillales bacterium]
MPSDDPAGRLRDIIENIDRIESYVAGMVFDDYSADRKTKDAVERCLQRITEAARKLGDEMDGRNPGVPWKAIREMGSILRHNYDKILDDVIWGTVASDLALLRAACEAELKRLGKG